MCLNKRKKLKTKKKTKYFQQKSQYNFDFNFLAGVYCAFNTIEGYSGSHKLLRVPDVAKKP